ncbi:helix-turn-helix transcriptional regulator [Pedobacter panaciterrae]|uniref:Helix-turn-helix transcriptional regulator n=1 Tax=Pedobacter panaciterrae TaxID=363849 RepID=A0ABU8NS09_9SPHI
MTENQRLKIAMKELGFSTQKEFATVLNVQQGSLSDILRSKEGVGVSNNIADKLEILYGINKTWLKTGEGEMISTSHKQNIQTRNNAKPLHEVHYPIEPGESPFIDMGNGQFTMLIPFVDEYAYASFPGGFRDPEYIEEKLRRVSITVNKQHSGRYFAFEIIGDSMENYESKEFAKKSIAEGSIVVARELERDNWKYKLHSHNWDVFIFIHSEYGIACKTILDQNIAEGTIKLGSFNPDKKRHKDFEWHIKDIQGIFNVVRVIQEL